MSIKRKLIKNSSYNLVVYFLLSVVALLTLPQMVEVLGLEQYGLFVLFNTITPLASVLEFGITSSLIRELALPNKQIKERHQIWQTGHFLMAFSGLLTVIFLGIIFSYFSHSQLFVSLDSTDFVSIVALVLGAVFLDRLGSHYLTIVQADQDFRLLSLRNLLVGLGNTLFSLIAAVQTKSLVFIFITQLVFYFLGAFIPFIYNLYYFKGKSLLPKIDLSIVKRVINFGWQNFIGKVASQLEGQLSRYILGFLLTPSAVGLFNIPQTLTQKSAGVISQIASAIYPASASLQTKDKIGKLVRLIIQLEVGIFVIGCFGIWAFSQFGETLLSLWLTNTSLVQQIYPLMQVMLWWLLLSALTPIPSMVLDGLNLPIIPSLSALVTLSFEVYFLLNLIPTLGVIGAAYALLYGSLFGVIPFVIVFFWILRREQLKISRQ